MHRGVTEGDVEASGAEQGCSTALHLVDGAGPDPLQSQRGRVYLLDCIMIIIICFECT